MLKVGRRADYQTEQANTSEKLFAQELSVDGLRHSDVRCTLCLYLIPVLTPRLLLSVDCYFSVNGA